MMYHFFVVERELPRKGLGFKVSTLLVRLLSHKPKMVNYGEGFPKGSFVIVANHEGMKTPTKLVEYFNHDVVFWAHHSITESYKELHKYICFTYLHNKKHLPKWLAFIVGSVVCPFIRRYYKSCRFIPVYRDLRSLKSIKTSTDAIKDGQQVVIFPEDSDDGYKERLEKLNNGYITLLEHLYKNDIHVPVILCYLNKKKNTLYFDKPFFYKDMKEKYGSHSDISSYLLKRLNSLDQNN